MTSPTQRSRQHPDDDVLVAPYHIHRSSDESLPSTPSSVYRGFSTSIAGSFQSVQDERVDACSLVCCGILQNDRDRYLLTGTRPPSTTRRLTTHILVPLAILLMAMDCALYIPDALLNQLISTTLVLSMLLYFVWQCCKGRWKRERVRKRLLLKKHRRIHNLEDDVDTEDEEDVMLNNPSHWMGQSSWDMHCAHALVGCYQRDMVYSNTDEASTSIQTTTASTEAMDPLSRATYTPPNNLCGCLWTTFTMACCGACGCHLMLCGMCALAQEARDIERISAFPIALDYITLEPALVYAPKLWDLRNKQDPNILAHLTTVSRLSNRIVKYCAVVTILGLVAWSVLHRQIGHSLVAVGAIGYAVIFLFLVHWPKHRFDVSVDVLVKCFASGFFLATTLAISWEFVVGMAIRALMTIIMTLSGVDVKNDPEYTYTMPHTGFAGMGSYRDYLQAFGHANPVLYVLYLFVNAFCVAALMEEVCKYYGQRMVDHPDLWSQEKLDSVVAAGVPQTLETRGDIIDDEVSQEDLQVAALSTNPTVSANAPVQAPKRTLASIATATTITMVAVALGFACLEDLIYIFVYNKGGSLSDEISVMVIRGMLPIHPIVAAIQSIGVCRRDLEKDSKQQLGRIILPAVIVHGTFDFGLSFIDFVANNAAGGWAALVFAFTVMIVGLIYYFKESWAQRQRLERLDQQASVDQSSLL